MNQWKKKLDYANSGLDASELLSDSIKAEIGLLII